jgi:phosphopantothenoylcysteine synthetase/decarboxylase
MPTEVQNENTQTQTVNNNSSALNDNNMLNNLLNSMLSQSVDHRKTKSPVKNSKSDDIVQNEEHDEEEEEDEDSDNDELISDEDDLRWIALSKLLDSHLRITKSFLHLVREN